jgi:hypothetical protein
MIEQLAVELAADPALGHLVLFGHRHTNLDAPFHERLIESYWSDAEQFVALCFRDAAKSTLAEECLILGSLVQAFHYAVIVCATVERAVQHLDSIKHEIESDEVIEEVFGDQRGETWQQTRITLANGVCIDAIGASQNTRGRSTEITVRTSYS